MAIKLEEYNLLKKKKNSKMNNKKQIYIIGLGYCKKYLDKNGNHIKYKENVKFIGNY